MKVFYQRKEEVCYAKIHVKGNPEESIYLVKRHSGARNIDDLIRSRGDVIVYLHPSLKKSTYLNDSYYWLVSSQIKEIVENNQEALFLLKKDPSSVF